MEFVKFGFDTDIGGNKKNQDRWFTWKNDEKRLCVFGIADGHGLCGEEAAKMTTKTVLEFIETNGSDLETDTLRFLQQCFTLAHENFRSICPPWTEITTTGGTTLSIVAIVDKKIYVANVGDSPVYLCTKSEVLTHSMIKPEMDFAVSPEMQQQHLTSEEDTTLCSVIEMTGNHSADNVREFDRVRKQFPSVDNPGYPELSFLYDKRSSSRNMASSYKTIFRLGENDEIIKDAEGGEYYKNVSKEWGSIVKGNLPGHLAFTRSIGDFYWKDYGVTEQPEIRSFDLKEFEIDDTVCIVAASDGVSDNWLCNMIGKFVMDPNCLNAVATHPDVGAERVARSFIRRNAKYALQNFGNDRDNATVVVAYLERKP